MASQKLARPGIVLWDGPEPLPDGGKWCIICIMTAKKLATDTHAKAIKEHEETGDGKVLRLPVMTEDTTLEPAALVAPSGAVPQFGFVDVCWSHVAGIEFLTPEQMQLRQSVAQGIQG